MNIHSSHENVKRQRTTLRRLFIRSSWLLCSPLPCDRATGAGLVPAAPHLTRGFDDEAQFGFLLLDRQSVAFDGRGKAALRAEAELLQRHVFGGLVDAALQVVLALERRPLAGDETQY